MEKIENLTLGQSFIQYTNISYHYHHPWHLVSVCVSLVRTEDYLYTVGCGVTTAHTDDVIRGLPVYCRLWYDDCSH